jgi:ATP-binding protein involved in chromosome partitioning
MDFLGEIPLDMVIRETSDGGRPIVIAEPDGVYAKAYQSIARAVLERIEASLRERAATAPRIVVS